MTKLKTGAATVVLVGAAAVVFLQQREIKRLSAESTALRDEIAQAAALREENQRLAAQLRASANDSEAGQRELIRLRAQSSRLRQLEQENAQLKVERQTQQAAAAAERQQRVSPPEVKASAPPAGITDFGVVELSDTTPVSLELGAGKQCIVTTTVLPDGNLQAVFTSESSVGVPVQNKQMLIMVPGKQVAAVINGVQITLTPTLKAK